MIFSSGTADDKLWSMILPCSGKGPMTKFFFFSAGTADDQLWPMIQKKLDVLNQAGLTKDNFQVVSQCNLRKAHTKIIICFFSGRSIKRGGGTPKPLSKKKISSKEKIDEKNINHYGFGRGTDFSGSTIKKKLCSFPFFLTEIKKFQFFTLLFILTNFVKKVEIMNCFILKNFQKMVEILNCLRATIFKLADLEW